MTEIPCGISQVVKLEDYKKNMDPEKRKEFEAKIAEARNAGAQPI